MPTAVMRPKLFLADRGLNRSLAISQNPEPRAGPMPETCRYTRRATSVGAAGSNHHSTTKRTAHTANAPGTNDAGDSRRNTLALASANRMEQIDVATTIAGREVTGRCAR